MRGIIPLIVALLVLVMLLTGTRTSGWDWVLPKQTVEVQPPPVELPPPEQVPDPTLPKPEPVPLPKPRPPSADPPKQKHAPPKAKPRPKHKPANTLPPGTCDQLSRGISWLGRERMREEAIRRGYTRAQIDHALQACGL